MSGPRQASAVLAALALLVGCVGAGGRGRVPEPEPATVALHLEFEPPLLVEGRLEVRHEALAAATLTTGCTGVRLTLPPGPVFLRLEAAGQTFERTLVVDPQRPEVVWQLVSR